MRSLMVHGNCSWSSSVRSVLQDIPATFLLPDKEVKRWWRSNLGVDQPPSFLAALHPKVPQTAAINIELLDSIIWLNLRSIALGISSERLRERGNFNGTFIRHFHCHIALEELAIARRQRQFTKLGKNSIPKLSLLVNVHIDDSLWRIKNMIGFNFWKDVAWNSAGKIQHHCFRIIHPKPGNSKEYDTTYWPRWGGKNCRDFQWAGEKTVNFMLRIFFLRKFWRWLSI